jgi:hypothetical protein
MVFICESPPIWMVWIWSQKDFGKALGRRAWPMDWNPTRKAMSIHSNPWANVGSSFFHQRGWSKAGFVSKYGIFHGIFLGTTSNLRLNIKLVSHYFLIIFPSFPTVFHHFPIIVP